MTVKGGDGKEVTIGTGDAFEVTAGHDAWVAGDEPCVALDFRFLKTEVLRVRHLRIAA
jgi:hypothetical protein